ncbi:MAG: hypothetical protein HYZ26_13295 [Chloroflexi bacterium]|nr:hypothetical protein [Chloroflexota bacterium]
MSPPLRALLTLAALAVLTLAFREAWLTGWASGFDVLRFSTKWALTLLGLFGLYGGILALLAVGLWRPARLAAPAERLAAARFRLGRARLALAALALLFPAWLLLYSPWGDVFTGFFTRLVLLLAASAAAAALAGRGPALLEWGDFLTAGLLAGSVFGFAKLFVNVTDHPFSLSWSEGNRLYDYSLRWGGHLYNAPEGASLRAAIDPGRQALWGLPWLFMSRPPIALARLWGALVVSVPYVLLGWFAVRPEAGGRRRWALFGLWVFLFVNQGPVYTPLVLAAILVAAARRAPLWLGFTLVALAGYYAYHSRLSWMFAPMLWAGMLALAGAQAERPARRDWLQALALGFAGLLGSFGFTQVIPPLWRYFQAVLSGQVVSGTGPGAVVAGQVAQSVADVLDMSEQIATQQTLLWQRLLPNASYGLGVLFGLLLAALPLILLLGWLARRGVWRLTLWKALALLLPMAAFLAVGLTASVKVGGGLDLHNLDMFLVGMVFAAALAWEGGAGRELLEIVRQQAVARRLLLLAVFIPAFVPMVDARPLALPPDDKTQVALATVQATVACAAQYGDVLFMDQRQLLAFGRVANVPLVQAYEKKVVMDQALSANNDYFQAFYADLQAGRFSLIVTEKQAVIYKDAGTSLAEENNAWVAWVTEPLLAYYESVADYRSVRVELFMPIGRDYDCAYP